MVYKAVVIGILINLEQARAIGGDFDYALRGEDWADKVEYADGCRAGREQSPIDLSTTIYAFSEKTEINGYGYERFIANTSSFRMPTYTVSFSGGELIHTDHEGHVRTFNAYEFDIHAPSEHTIDGKRYALEIHIYHYYKGTDGQLGAGIAILFDIGRDESDIFESIYNVYDIGQGYIEMEEFLQSVDFTRYWMYDGSFAQPPCYEGMKWVVLRDIQYLSQDQFDRLMDGFKADPQFSEYLGNSRITQPLNGRQVFYSASKAFSVSALALSSMLLALL